MTEIMKAQATVQDDSYFAIQQHKKLNILSNPLYVKPRSD